MFPAFHPHLNTPEYPYPLNRDAEDPFEEFEQVYGGVAALRGLTQTRVALEHGRLLGEWATINYLSNPTFREKVQYFKPQLYTKAALTISTLDGGYAVDLDLATLPPEILFKMVKLERGLEGMPSFSTYHSAKQGHETLSKLDCTAPVLGDDEFVVRVDTNKNRTVLPGTELYMKRTFISASDSSGCGYSLEMANISLLALNGGTNLFAINTAKEASYVYRNILRNTKSLKGLPDILLWDDTELTKYDFHNMPLFEAFERLGKSAPSKLHKDVLTALKKRLRTEFPLSTGSFKPEKHSPPALRLAGCLKAYYGASVPALDTGLPVSAINKGENPTLIYLTPSGKHRLQEITFPGKDYFNLAQPLIGGRTYAHLVGINPKFQDNPTAPEWTQLWEAADTVRKEYVQGGAHYLNTKTVKAEKKSYISAPRPIVDL